MCRKFWTFMLTWKYGCESKKKYTFFRKIFFSSSEKLIFENENVIFLNTFLNFDLVFVIVVIFL